MVNAERPPFERESRLDSVFWLFDLVLPIFFRDEHEFCDTLNDTTLAIALIGAADDVYIPILHCMSIDRRERILAIISQSHDVTEEDIEAAQSLIYEEAGRFDRAYYLKNHMFSWYDVDVDELGDVECLTIPEGILEIASEPFVNYTYEKNYNLVAEERISGWWDRTIQPGIQTIVLPDSLKRIGDLAFRNMVCLKNIHFGNSLEHIGEDAFENCDLEKIELPGSVKDIGESAFAHCHYLESVKFSEGIEVIPKRMFHCCTSLREVILPNTIKEIGSYAFLDCFDLEKVSLPEGLTVIAEGLFADCGSLQEIYIPESVTQIEDNAFGSYWHESCAKHLVITCHQDSFAHQYAIENNIKFNLETFQEAFVKALDRKPEDEYKVLVYYGIGGIGKTSLIKQLESKLEEINPNAICVSLDFATSHFRQQDEALALLVDMLSRKYRIPFPTYDIAYKFYWKKTNPNQSLDERWWYMPVREEETLRELESMEPQQILDKLPIYFAQDFSDHLKTKKQPAVIFLDTYEALWENNKDVGHHSSKDAWVRDLIAQLPLPADILWVICGRERLRWEEIKNDNWGDYIEQHLIGSLADRDIRDFLNNWGITDSIIQDAIVESSEGVPFYLDLSVEIYYKESTPQADIFTGTHDELLKRFVKYLDRSEKAALEVLSASRFWDRDLFDYLLTKFDTGYPHQLFTELMKHSFISKTVISGKTIYSMHQLMSKNLQDFQDEEDRQRIHKYLFEYYSGQLPEKEAKSISEQNITALREAVYHRSECSEITELSEWFYDIAKVFDKNAQYNLLIELYLSLLTLQEEGLYFNHPDVATTCNNLAGLYQIQEKYARAEPLYLRALKIREEDLGPDHPNVATTCNNLAGLYQIQKKYAQAEPLYLRALKIREEVLGADHPDVATAYNNLAILYRNQEKYDQAEPLYLRALKINEEVLGPDHPDVATVYNNLASLYEDQGKYAQAEPLYLRALKIREEVLGPDHPNTINTSNNLNNLRKLND